VLNVSGHSRWLTLDRLLLVLAIVIAVVGAAAVYLVTRSPGQRVLRFYRRLSHKQSPLLVTHNQPERPRAAMARRLRVL
jgi:hypothetical protein